MHLGIRAHGHGRHADEDDDQCRCFKNDECALNPTGGPSQQRLHQAPVAHAVLQAWALHQLDAESVHDHGQQADHMHQTVDQDQKHAARKGKDRNADPHPEVHQWNSCEYIVSRYHAASNDNCAPDEQQEETLPQRRKVPRVQEVLAPGVVHQHSPGVPQEVAVHQLTGGDERKETADCDSKIHQFLAPPERPCYGEGCLLHRAEVLCRSNNCPSRQDQNNTLVYARGGT
mmetsp:Transcript_77042/g.178692  ORF Transcript_77042/g.178692 Transcript_77042/m.178692 type:complete len:230 (-) Transcript_77042:1403-2092(-)